VLHNLSPQALRTCRLLKIPSRRCRSPFEEQRHAATGTGPIHGRHGDRLPAGRRRFLRTRRLRLNSISRRSVAKCRKAAANEPCPGGSGKKFTNFCGARCGLKQSRFSSACARVPKLQLGTALFFEALLRQRCGSGSSETLASQRELRNRCSTRVERLGANVSFSVESWGERSPTHLKLIERIVPAP